MTKYLLAIDEGTTGSTALIVGLDGQTIAKATTEFPQHFPKPGWVEHDLSEIWSATAGAISAAMAKVEISGTDILAIGITNQRETTVVWDKKTGEPIHRAIVWQCRRTAPTCDALKAAGHAELIQSRTGLVLDAYFSATKIAWILDNVEGARTRASRGDLAFGTIDSYLIHKLTNGAVHATDGTNASRTLLMDLRTLKWDAEMCDLFRVPMSMLPAIVESAETIGHTKGLTILPDGIPIAGIAGDQQAALFGQGCLRVGESKCTYGTGAFALLNIGHAPVMSKSGLVTTVAWTVAGKTSYALEGSSFIAGAAVQWLRDGLGMIRSAEEIEALANSVPSTDGVSFVPALSGLGAPYWDQDARGIICGITRGTTSAHLARATLEGIALSVADLLLAMQKDSGQKLARLRVDGGAAKNNLLMQIQSDFSGISVERGREVESTGRGAALLAGIGVGACTLEEVGRMTRIETIFSPGLAPKDRENKASEWQAAVRRCRSQA